MDRKLKAEALALVFLLLAFPLTSLGKMADTPMWWIGLLSLIAGGVLPVITRYMDHSKDTTRDVGLEFDDRTS